MGVDLRVNFFLYVHVDSKVIEGRMSPRPRA
jgi:hypothetical protein